MFSITNLCVVGNGEAPRILGNIETLDQVVV